MSWRNIDKFNIKDPHENVPLDELFPLSERAFSHLIRSGHLPVLKESFVNIFGAIEMMHGLTYHHARFMNLINDCHMQPPTGEVSRNLRHEAVAYVNRLGQFWAFAQSTLIKNHCPSPEDILPTISSLIVFRNKHAAHRSIDNPKKEDEDDLQIMNAISLSILGGSFFRPKPGYQVQDISSMKLETEEDWGKLTCNHYKNYFLGFQIFDVKRNMHVDFHLECDHVRIMEEAYNLIKIILPLGESQS